MGVWEKGNSKYRRKPHNPTYNYVILISICTTANASFPCLLYTLHGYTFSVQPQSGRTQAGAQVSDACSTSRANPAQGARGQASTARSEAAVIQRG